MSAPRTVTVRTVDHGPVTLACPDWCTVDHAEQDGGNRADIVHHGPEVALAFHGFTLLSAALVAYPYAQRLGRGPAVAVDVGGEWHSVGASALRELAAGLVVHAERLRDLADELAALQGAEGGGAL